MRHRITRFVARLVTGRPGTVGVAILLVAALSAWAASRLHINDNQLDLIDQDLPQVVAAKQMMDVVGSVGFLIMAIKGDDPERLKAVADDLAARIDALPAVIKITYKQEDVSFIRERIGLYIQPDDMQEAYSRIRTKVKSVLRKANPFHFELRKTEERELDLSDLVDKYRTFNKKVVDDPYYVDTKKEMILLIIKPAHNSSELGATQRLLDSIEGQIAQYNASGEAAAKLVESYGSVPTDGTVSYGYTGTYKRNLDDSESIRAALVPTSLIAFFGIFAYLLLTLRRLNQILLVMATLVLSVTMAFAFCELVIGELNTITAILGAILMGLGIDFGIHFIYRLREEYTRGRELVPALHATIEHSGAASLTSAMTTAATLYVLILSGFKGFSHFGLVAGTGVLLTATMMYTAIPVAYLLLDRIWPSFKNNLIVPQRSAKSGTAPVSAYPFAKPILLGSVGVTLVLGFFATRVEFSYDSRSIMSSDRPSLVLQEDIRQRYGISTDPVGVYTETIEEARALYDAFTPLPDDTMIDSVVSLFIFTPPKEQQEHNREVMQRLKADLDPLEPSILDEEQQAMMAKFLPYLDAEPFELGDLPASISKQFRAADSRKYGGYLTFIYPKVSLWDGKDLLRFADEVTAIEVAGKTYHSAGMAVLYAYLARTVLNDGRNLTLLAAVVIFLIILANFWNIRATFFAMLPLLAGIGWMLGLMALSDWRINFFNVVVFPVVLGYGISNGVHLYHRFLESGSVMVAVRQTGSAVIASSVTTLIGWGALLASHHLGLESMGILACFGITSALVVSLTVLPALLQVAQGWRSGADADSVGAAEQQPS